MRLVLLLVIGCGAEEEERVVSQDTYPNEYAAAICAVQFDCDLWDDVETCVETVESRWEGKLNMGCFDETAAKQCLDVLDSLDCAGYDNDEWSVCNDVDDCSEV